MDNYNIFLSVKHSPIAKPPVAKGSILTFGWQAVSLSPAALVRHIATEGKPIAVSQFSEGHRNKKKFLRSNLIALDYDGNYSDPDYQALIASDFFRRYCFAIIQTASSKPNSRRCRVLFRLDQTIENKEDYAELVLFIMSLSPDGADMGARDVSRAFYGSRPGTVPDFYNPANVLAIAPFLEEIRQQRQRKAEEKAARPVSELSGDLIADIEKALGVSEFNAGGWSKAIPCIVSHAHDDSSPAAFWNEESHILNCFKCGRYYLAKEVAAALGIEYRRPDAAFSADVDLSTAPDEMPSLAALPNALRKVMIRDGLTLFCQVLDRLLWEEFPPDRLFTLPEITPVMQAYGMSQAAVYRTFTNYSHFFYVNILKFSPSKKSDKNSKAGRKAEVYTLAAILASLEKHYGYPLQDGGSYLYDHEAALHSAKDYRKFALLEYLPEVEQTLSLEAVGEEWNLSAATIGTYTRELRDLGLLEINRHQKRRELSADDIPNLSQVLEEWKRAFSNAYIEMFTVEDGVRVPFLHKGGKRGIQNNRIPPLYRIAMYFFHKTLKKHIIKSVNSEHSNLCFVLVSKMCNSYRRLPVPEVKQPLLGRLREGIAA